MDLAKDSLERKRIFVKEMYDRGLYPYTKDIYHTLTTTFQLLE